MRIDWARVRRRAGSQRPARGLDVGELQVPWLKPERLACLAVRHRHEGLRRSRLRDEVTGGGILTDSVDGRTVAPPRRAGAAKPKPVPKSAALIRGPVDLGVYRLGCGRPPIKAADLASRFGFAPGRLGMAAVDGHAHRPQLVHPLREAAIRRALVTVTNGHRAALDGFSHGSAFDVLSPSQAAANRLDADPALTMRLAGAQPLAGVVLVPTETVASASRRPLRRSSLRVPSFGPARPGERVAPARLRRSTATPSPTVRAPFLGRRLKGTHSTTANLVHRQRGE